MNYEILSTGSKGNCIILNGNIMLDCGVPFKKIKEKMKGISFVFISHIHSDHFNKATISKIAFEYPNIKFVVGHYLVKQLMDCGVKAKNIWVLNIGVWYDLGLCKVRLDYLLHDVPNNCIHIEYKNSKKVIYATDTTSIDHIIAKDYDLYLIEANYETDEILREKIKEAEEKGEFTHLKRVLKTHLSQLQALNWLQENNKNGGDYIFIHQHEEKNNE